MKFSLATAIAASAAFLIVLPGHAATFFSLNQNVVQLNTGTPESELRSGNAVKINLGDTRVYADCIGINQVSSNNQDSIVTSFTTGARTRTQSCETSSIDARGLGLLYDEGSDNLYDVFTADGSSQGPNTFGAATESSGWLSGYGSGGPIASVLLKLNPDNRGVEAGTSIRDGLSNGRTNTVRPTDLDLVNDEVIFLGNSFFRPLDTDSNPFDSNARTSVESSPFDHHVVLTSDLSAATSTEANGWNGLTAFTPLRVEVDKPDEDEDDMANVGEDDEDEIDDSDDSYETGGDDGSDNDDMADAGVAIDNNSLDDLGDGDIADGNEEGEESEPVSEPGLVAGLMVALSGATCRKRLVYHRSILKQLL
ncbi:MAG: hypothetical protein AAF609_08075 [Cyanobacteria bacterium P01_C01_bin.120]